MTTTNTAETVEQRASRLGLLDQLQSVRAALSQAVAERDRLDLVATPDRDLDAADDRVMDARRAEYALLLQIANP